MSFHILLGQLLCVNAIPEAPAFFPVLILLPSVVIGLRRRRAALEKPQAAEGGHDQRMSVSVVAHSPRNHFRYNSLTVPV